jgi:hypothetical protein
MVEEHRRAAERLADEFQPEALRQLAHYLIDTVLERPTSAGPSRRPLAVPAR